MAMTHNTQTIPFGAVALHRAIRALDSLVESVQRWHRRRVTRKALMQLSDRELADIGLSRAEIDTIEI